MCGIESYATSIYTKSRPFRASRSVEDSQKRQSDSDNVAFYAPVKPPGSFVPHYDLESDFIISAANAAANLIYHLNSGGNRQTADAPVVQSAYTNVVAGINYDMNMVLDGSIYHILMFQDLDGVYSFTTPPQIIGTVGGSGGLTGGDIAAIVVCSVFGAVLVAAAGVYLATRNGDSSSNDESEASGKADVAESQKGRFGMPVMNPFSHIRRVKAGEHQSVTARSEPQ